MPRPRATFVAAALVAFLAVLAACAVGSDAETDGNSAADSGKPTLQIDAAPAEPIEASVVADANPPDAPVSDPCALALAKITYDFEAGAAGWTHATSDGATGSWPFDPWVTGTSSVGPACSAGKCFGTELTKNYAQCARASLSSPIIDLSTCAGKTVALVFNHAYSFWTGSYGGSTWFDGGVVEASGDGSTWVPAQGAYPGTVKINPDRTPTYACVATPFGVHNKQGFVGVQSTTTKAELTLPAAAISATTRIRFSFASGVSSQTTNPDTSRTATAPGWRIDDVGFLMK